jgi:hypothetical protein
MPSSTYVQLPVPEEYYPDVLDFLATRMAAPRPEAEEQTLAQADESRNEGRNWSQDTWERVWPDLTDLQRQALVVLAERQGEWVHILEWMQALGVEFNTFQGSLASLTRRVQRDGTQRLWPFEIEHDTDGDNRAKYRMNSVQASIVLRLASP